MPLETAPLPSGQPLPSPPPPPLAPVTGVHRVRARMESVYLDDLGYRRYLVGSVIIGLSIPVAIAMFVLILSGWSFVWGFLWGAVLVAGAAVTAVGTRGHRLEPARCPACEMANAPGSTLCESCGGPVPPSPVRYADVG